MYASPSRMYVSGVGNFSASSLSTNHRTTSAAHVQPITEQQTQTTYSVEPCRTQHKFVFESIVFITIFTAHLTSCLSAVIDAAACAACLRAIVARDQQHSANQLDQQLPSMQQLAKCVQIYCVHHYFYCTPYVMSFGRGNRSGR